MKTNFTSEEIKSFLMKQKDLIVGDEAIVKALNRPQEGENVNMTEAIDRIYKIGTDHGHIMGRIAILTLLLDFFEFDETQD